MTLYDTGFTDPNCGSLAEMINSDSSKSSLQKMGVILGFSQLSPFFLKILYVGLRFNKIYAVSMDVSLLNWFTASISSSFSWSSLKFP